MYESTATLYAATETKDNYGNIIETYEKNTVFVKPRSVYANDFYNAATAGLKPEIVLIISTMEDYHREKLVEFNGEMYNVIRAYQRPERDTVELTLELRIGDIPEEV